MTVEVVNQTDKTQTISPVSYRQGTIDDTYMVFKIFEQSLADLTRRLGATEATSAADPAALARMWDERRSLYEHLAKTAEHFWLAERDGQPIGYSRSIIRDGLRLLTELCILPDDQSIGVGRELLARSFPLDGAKYRSILSSPDVRAQALYLKAGVHPDFSAYYWWRQPEKVEMESDLSFQPITGSDEQLVLLSELDRQLLGFRRDVDHLWLSGNRQGYLYHRDGRPVGYGYPGKRNGPFALLNDSDFPVVLAQAETEAHSAGFNHFGLELPMINHAAVDYLLERGFRMEPFIIQFMRDQPFGSLENYVMTSPPFFI